MANNGNNGVVLISTMQNRLEMVKTGGVVMPTPRVNRDRIESTCNYIVCCNEKTGDAFLIGTIDRVLWVDEKCVIKIKNYALIDRPQVWQECGNKYNFGYLTSPSQMHMHVGRLKFTPIYESAYTNGNGNGKNIAATVANHEVKKSAIVTYPKPKTQDIESAKKIFANDGIEFAAPAFDRITQLRKELAELEASRKAMLHSVIDKLSDAQIDQAIQFFANFKLA